METGRICHLGKPLHDSTQARVDDQNHVRRQKVHVTCQKVLVQVENAASAPRQDEPAASNCNQEGTSASSCNQQGTSAPGAWVQLRREFKLYPECVHTGLASGERTSLNVPDVPAEQPLVVRVAEAAREERRGMENGR